MMRKYFFVFFVALSVFLIPAILFAQEGAVETIYDSVPESLSADNMPVSEPSGIEIIPDRNILFDNGPIITHYGTGAGGANESRLQTGLGMSVYGFTSSVASGYRLADDFTISAPSGFDLNAVYFFAYQTGSTTTSTMNALNMRIWDGIPGAAGSNIVWGDTTTNRLTNTLWSNIYRVLDTASGNTQRPVMINRASVGVHLNPGTYWVDWQAGGTLVSGPFVPPITMLGQTTTGNARQSGDGITYNPISDVGAQGIPFIIEGTVSDVVVTYPNGSEMIPTGSTLTIRWAAPDTAKKFNVYLSMNNGLTWSVLAKQYAKTSFDWLVPPLASNKKKCLVRVKAYDQIGVRIGTDTSDATFTIEVVRLTSPNGGETWVSGGTPTFTWTTNATIKTVAKVQLYYTTNNGVTWKRITTILGNPGTYSSWTVPTVTASKPNSKVKVILKDNDGNVIGTDVSDAVFTINPI